MSAERERGGEPNGARLLELARRELLELMPVLEGEARYRARLIANAMKIARHDLAAGPADTAATMEELRRFAADTLAEPATTEASASAGTLSRAVRAGHLDGDEALHALLVRVTERRRAALG